MRNAKKLLAVVFMLMFAAGVFAEEPAAAAVTPEQSGVAAAAANEAVVPAKEEIEIETRIGGHIKMTVFDRPASVVRGNNVTGKIEKSYGIGFRELNIFIDTKINDWLSFQVDPKFSASSGATPKLVTYTPVAATTGTDYAFTAFGHGKAVMRIKLPWDVQMEVGQVRPRFTLEYGAEMFWEESMNGGKFSCNDNLGSVHDSGIEFLKDFALGDVTIPVYLYYLNGGTEKGAFDLNNSPGAMLRIEPTWNGLTALGSIYAARYDVKELKAWTKWSAGFMYNWENLGVRAEFVRGKKELFKSGLDLLSEGYYAKATYKVIDWLKLYAMYESAQDNQSDMGVKVPVRYQGATAGFDVYLSDATMLQFQCDVEDWRTADGKAATVYTRPFLGVRTTF